MEGYCFQDADPEAFDILAWIDTLQNIQFTLGGCMDLDQALALADGLERLDTCLLYTSVPGALHHRVASGALVSGYSGRPGPGLSLIHIWVWCTTPRWTAI